MATKERKPEDVKEIVRERYGSIARQSEQGCGCEVASCCGSGYGERLAKSVGYADGDLAVLPDGANMGLSCGNPTALASLKTGETVLDLGSGGGFDVFIAARKVGPEGQVIGVDMTADMIEKARKNAESFKKESGMDNVEFRMGEIEKLPVADNSIDVVISNCVINLSPDKPRVWSEIARVLKPGGRVSVSDLALLKPLPDEVREMTEALVGCVAGAVLVEETATMVHQAGLEKIELDSKPGLVDAMSDWEDPLYRKIMENLPEGSKPGDYVTSLDITAVKSKSGGRCGCGCDC